MPQNKLEQLFALQRALQLRLNGEIPDVETNQEYVSTMTLALVDEIFEALRETPWKPWKKTAELSRENYKEELVDAWHFLINLTLASGMDADELYTRFVGKNAENHKRQDEGY